MNSGDDYDRALMRKLVDGEGEALNDLMALHGPKLFHFLLRLLRNEFDAQDIAQEAFVRVFQHASKFNPTHKFSTWMFTIASNLAKDRLRSASLHPEVPLEQEGGREAILDTFEAQAKSPLSKVQAEELSRDIEACVGQLPQDQQLALILQVYEGLTQDEIALVMNCSRKAVELRIYRAKRTLRDIFKRDPKFTEGYGAF